MITFPYDQAYDPAAPACQVTLSVASTGQRVSMMAMIDTGADASIIPVSYLRQIAARRAFEGSLRSQWGERRRIYLYLVDLHLENLTLPGVYVVGDDQGDEVVLGRDVLNRLRLLLDGPKQVASCRWQRRVRITSYGLLPLAPRRCLAWRRLWPSKAPDWWLTCAIGRSG